MTIVSVDESGYNGGNLLDEKQTWMALSVVDISEAQADELIRLNLPGAFTDSEAKHSKLYGDPKNDDGLVAVQYAAYECYEASSYVINKRQACCESFVLDCVADIWPRFSPGTKDYCGLIAYLENLSMTDSGFATLLDAYLAFSNGKRGGELQFLNAFGDQTNAFIREVGDRLWRDPYSLGMIDKTQTASGLVVGMLMELIRHLDAKLKDDFVVLYDESAAIDNFSRAFAEQLDKPDNVAFLTKYKGMQSGVSSEHRSLQIADILAGGSIRFAKTMNGEELTNEARTNYGYKMKDMFDRVKREDALLFKFKLEPCDYQKQVQDITNFWMA